MKANELTRQRVQRVEMYCITPDHMPPLTVYGINGGSEFVTGICVAGTVYELKPYDPFTGTPAESVDGLTIRAARELVPALPPTAPRDANGRAIGYLIYRGLPADHCKPA